MLMFMPRAAFFILVSRIFLLYGVATELHGHILLLWTISRDFMFQISWYFKIIIIFLDRRCKSHSFLQFFQWQFDVFKFQFILKYNVVNIWIKMSLLVHVRQDFVLYLCNSVICIFIGPRSDHSLCQSLIYIGTWCHDLKMEWVDPCWLGYSI